MAVMAPSGEMGILPFSAQNAAYANPALDDTQAPSIPTGLSATAASGSQLNLAWTASTDDVGVTGYKVYRNGTQIGTSPSPSYDDTGASPNARSTYAISAYDAAGNESEPSQASVVVLCASGSQADVTTAIGLTTYGDVVTIPPCDLGDCVWTNGIEITKDITIKGAGIDKTFITNNIPEAGDYTYPSIFKFVPDENSRNRLSSLSEGEGIYDVSGISFSSDSPVSYRAHLTLYNWALPPVRRVRLHDNKFETSYMAINAYGYIYGVVDSNIFINARGPKIGGAEHLNFSEDRMLPGDINIPGSLMLHDARGGKNIVFYNKYLNDDVDDIRVREEYSDWVTNETLPEGRCADNAGEVQTCTDACICQKVHDSYFFNNRKFTTNAVIGVERGSDYDCLQGIDACRAVHGSGPYPVLNNPPELVENREFFDFVESGFDGTAGVGCGTFGNRPRSCTVGTGYWATDQDCTDLSGMVGANPATPISGTLLKCMAPNTWTPWYTPFPYPHPLRDAQLPVKPTLALQGQAADRVIHLSWELTANLPPTSTWRIAHVNQLDPIPITIGGIVSTTRAYDLDNLTNGIWYTVTLNAMLDAAPILTGTVSVKPGDPSAVLFLPLVSKGVTAGQRAVALVIASLAACLAVFALRRS